MNVVRFRLVVLAGIAVTLGAGLGITAAGLGRAGEYAGGVLYACLIAWLILLAAPRTRPVPLLAATAAACWSVEFFQLTPWPAEWAEHSTLARLVFGTTFSASDLPAYAVGAVLAAGLLALARLGSRRGEAARPRGLFSTMEDKHGGAGA